MTADQPGGINPRDAARLGSLRCGQPLRHTSGCGSHFSDIPTNIPKVGANGSALLEHAEAKDVDRHLMPEPLNDFTLAVGAQWQLDYRSVSMFPLCLISAAADLELGGATHLCKCSAPLSSVQCQTRTYDLVVAG